MAEVPDRDCNLAGEQSAEGVIFRSARALHAEITAALADALDDGWNVAIEAAAQVAIDRSDLLDIHGSRIAREIRKLLRPSHPAPDDGWRDIASAPKDGTLLLLLVRQEGDERSSNPVENEIEYRTIGHNNSDNDGEDVWHFAGWCWSHDHFVAGRGTSTKWRPLPPPPVERKE